MKVNLIDYTGKGSADPARSAANLLVFTKNTRLNMTPGLLEDIERWPMDRITTELEYMANTIPSSWEFIHYTFLITGVTRAFTHQFVRTRTASYAQQTMRVLDVSEGPGWSYLAGPTIDAKKERADIYQDTMGSIAEAYRNLIAAGAAVEDARGVLPTNILTNIAVSMNMRTFVEMVRKRTSPRVQGEYRDVLYQMREAVLAVHPWAHIFINRTADVAARELYDAFAKMPKEEAMRLSKLLDQVYAP
jgi:flavin-dependent thymidylate synthase